MIKKPTLIVLLLAIVLGVGAYFYQAKHAGTDTAADTSKPVFSVQAADIQNITVERLNAKDSPELQMKRQGEDWEITQPVTTPADRSSVDGIADGLASARVSQTEPGTPDRLKAYGLRPGALSISFTLKNGVAHKILLGDKDFTGDNVYGVVDSSGDVSLLPLFLLTSADKGLDDFRDKSDLHVDADTAVSVQLKNASGEIALKKDADGNTWSLTKPETTEADSDAVTALVGALSTGKMKSVASETPDHPEKYGLANPEITASVTDGVGKTTTLIVGKKDGDDYYAKDTSRPMIFKIDADLYKKLAETPVELRDKSPLRVDESDTNQFELHDANGSMVATKKTGTDDWILQSPDNQKGKTISAWKVFSPVSTLKADEIIEKPSAEVLARLKDPAYEIIFTDNSGKKRTLRISKDSGDFVYAQSSESPAVYKLKKESVNDLNLKPTDLTSTT